jgi:short-subunit dehydrogenase
MRFALPVSLIFKALLLLLATTTTTTLVACSPTNVIVVGGSSDMGKAAALAALQRGGRVMLISRSEEKLLRAKRELESKCPEADVKTQSCDVSNEEAVEKLAKSIDVTSWNSLVISAAGKAPHGPVVSLPTTDTRDMMESKVWTA